MSAKAKEVCEQIKSFFEEDRYFLMGIERKTATYPRGMSFMKTPQEKAKIESTGEIAVDNMSSKQYVLFSNLTTIDEEKFPDLIGAQMVEDMNDPNAKNLVMINYRKNKLGQDVVTKIKVIFRYYTEEEKAEFLKKQEMKNAELMGFGNSVNEADMLKSLLAF